MALRLVESITLGKNYAQTIVRVDGPGRVLKFLAEGQALLIVGGSLVQLPAFQMRRPDLGVSDVSAQSVAGFQPLETAFEASHGFGESASSAIDYTLKNGTLRQHNPVAQVLGMR